jgi:hypothetical protein
MSEFYWQPQFGRGGPPSEEPRKKPESVDEAVLFLQRQADVYLGKATKLALFGDESAKKDIESNIAAYRSILSIVGGADERLVEDVWKHFRLNVLTEKFRQRLEKRIFG